MYNPILLYGTKFYRDLLDPGKTNKQGVKNSAAQFPFSQNLNLPGLTRSRQEHNYL